MCEKKDSMIAIVFLVSFSLWGMQAKRELITISPFLPAVPLPVDYPHSHSDRHPFVHIFLYVPLHSALLGGPTGFNTGNRSILYAV